jgi:hypothetical protein
MNIMVWKMFEFQVKTYYIMIDGDAGYTCGADVEDVEGDFRISVQELNGIPASTNDSICHGI